MSRQSHRSLPERVDDLTQLVEGLHEQQVVLSQQITALQATVEAHQGMLQRLLPPEHARPSTPPAALPVRDDVVIISLSTVEERDPNERGDSQNESERSGVSESHAGDMPV